MMIINMAWLMASFWMVSSSIGGLAATSWMASLSSEFDDFASSQNFSNFYQIRWKICIWTKSKQSADFCYDTLKIYVEAKSSNSDDNEAIQDFAARPPMLDEAIQNEAKRPYLLLSNWLSPYLLSSCLLSSYFYHLSVEAKSSDDNILIDLCWGKVITISWILLRLLRVDYDLCLLSTNR